MTEQLLREIAETGLATPTDLGRRLGVSDGTVAMMLRLLVERGYLAPAPQGCAAACAGCADAVCSTHAPQQIWYLTEKGRRVLARLQPAA